MSDWRWTCDRCGETGLLEATHDILENRALRHLAGHADGPFDDVPSVRLELVSPKPTDPSSGRSPGNS